MNQDEINESEWRDPKNWSVLIYRSHIDSRFFVPKRRGFGVTMNFGHKYATIATIVFLLLLLLPAALVTLVVLIKK